MVLLLVAMDIKWIIGRQSRFSLWKDPWLKGRSLESFIPIPVVLKYTKLYRVNSIIQNGERLIPQELALLYSVVTQEISTVIILESDADELIWDCSADGEIFVKKSYEQYRERLPSITRKKRIWRSYPSEDIYFCAENYLERNTYS